MGMLCGVAERAIAMPSGGALTGYVARLSPAAGVHDPLAVRCAVFDGGGARFALVACDLLALDADTAKRIAGLVARRTGLASDAVIVHCIHTHAGPASIFLQNCGEVDDRWLDGLAQDVAGCVGDALQNCRPSFFAVRSGVCRAAFNRVTGRKNQDEETIDREVTALEIADAPGGPPHAVLVNFACHPVAADCTLEYSRDFPHALDARLKRGISPDLRVIYLTGCCGDLNPIFRGGFAGAERIGKMVARGVRRARAVPGLPGEGDAVSVKTVMADIPLEHGLTAETLAGTIEEKERELAALRKRRASRKRAVEENVCLARLNWARRMLERLRAGELPAAHRAEMKVARIGELTVVTLPFEVFSETGRKIKALFGDGSTMVISCAGGDFGYLPSRRLYERAAYEAGEAHVYYGYPGPVAPNAEDILLQCLREAADAR